MAEQDRALDLGRAFNALRDELSPLDSLIFEKMIIGGMSAHELALFAGLERAEIARRAAQVLARARAVLEGRSDETSNN